MKLKIHSKFYKSFRKQIQKYNFKTIKSSMRALAYINRNKIEKLCSKQAFTKTYSLVQNELFILTEKMLIKLYIFIQFEKISILNMAFKVQLKLKNKNINMKL